MKTNQTSRVSWTLFSPKPLEFPPLCARCGVATDKTISVKITAGKPGLKPTILLGHVGHIIEAAESLRAGSTKVPCCSRCSRASRIGRRISLALLVGGPIVFILMCKYSDVWPEWLTMTATFVAIAMFFPALLPDIIGQKRSVPVSIWRGGGGYHYQFYSMAYVAWAERQKAESQRRKLEPGWIEI